MQWPGRRGEYKKYYDDDGFNCVVCAAETAGGAELREHLWAFHKIGEPLRCKKCSLVFKWKKTLQAHARKCDGYGRKSALLVGAHTYTHECWLSSS